MSSEPTSAVESTAVEFRNVRKAVRAFERASLAGKFAIGDALILDIGEPHAGKYGTVQAQFEKVAIDLQTIGYDGYAVHNLRDMRETAHAFKPDHRLEILEVFPHLTFSIFHLTTSDPTILDDLVMMMETGDRPPRIPEVVMVNVKKRKTIRATDIAQIKASLKRLEAAARDAAQLPPPRVDREAKPRMPSMKTYTMDEVRRLLPPSAAIKSTNEDVIVVKEEDDDGVTFNIDAEIDEDREERVPASIEQLVDLLRRAEQALIAFSTGWPLSGCQPHEGIMLLEKLDDVRAAWERIHLLINDYIPEMH